MTPEDAPPPPSSEPGYLGLFARTFGVDRKSVAEHGPCVIVKIFSPAWKEGARSGDFISSINEMGYYEFHSELPAVGSPFHIVAWRVGLGTLHFFGQLGNVPKRRLEPESWNTPTTMPGKSVVRKERPFFMQGYISMHPNLNALDTRLLSLLLNYEGHKGIFPKRQTLTKHLRCSLSTLDRSIQRCKQVGVLRVESGKPGRQPNRYFVTWPINHPRSKSEE
jgi:hypothetical protein